MGPSPSKPFKELTKEEVSSAVANLGDRYEGYCEALVGNGVDGSLLNTLDDDEILETLDDLQIANRLHRRVLLMELNKARLSKENSEVAGIASPYGYSTSTPPIDLEAYRRVTEKCLLENRKTALVAGVHLVLSDGTVLSLDTKIIKDGKLVTQRPLLSGKLSICSRLVMDGSTQHYYKIELPPEMISTLEMDDSQKFTYTGHIIKNEAGERVGMVCMIDRCKPSDLEDNDRAAFLWQAAREVEFQLLLRKQLIARKENLQKVIEGYLVEIDPVSPCQSPRLRNAHQSYLTPVHHKSPQVPTMTHVSKFPSDKTFKIGEGPQMSLHQLKPTSREQPQRPGMVRNDTERLASLGLLRLEEISPDEEIAIHLRRIVKMATQLFGFQHGEIFFESEEKQYRIAGYGVNDEISFGFQKIFQPITTNPDGTCFLSRIVTAQTLCRDAAACGRTFIVHNIAADESFRKFSNVLPIRCYVGSPVKDASGNTMAVLCLFDSKPRPDFNAAQEMQIEHIGRLISQSLENWALSRVAQVLLNETKMITRGSMKTGPPKGDVTIVVTDIEGSTAMWEATPASMQEAQDLHDEILRKACAAHWGFEVETEGDSFILAFHDPVDAVGFALKAQESLFKAEWPDEILRQPQAMERANAFRGIRVRMGIHHGYVGPCDEMGRVDYKGETLNFAKNLSSISHGGQILITSETWSKASHYTGSALAYPQVVDLGAHVIKKGKTTRDGLVTKGIIQLVPKSLAYDYANARKLTSSPEEERPNFPTVDGILPGRQFPPILSMKQVSAAFHDAPFRNNEVTVAFVDMSFVDENSAPSLVHLMGSILSSMPPLTGYQCTKKIFAFSSPDDAILFGLRVQSTLSERCGCRKDEQNLSMLIKYVCTQGTFQTMGPNRSTGRAEYFGKVVNRAERLSTLATAGTVCFGVFQSKGCEDENTVVVSKVDQHPGISCQLRWKRTLSDIQEELALYECTLKGSIDSIA